MEEEIQDENLCTYCGMIAECREHVIPVCYLSYRSYDPLFNWIVPSCNDCNSLAGASFAISIPDKAKIILKKFDTKYKKFIRMPEWSKDELDSVGYKLRVMIWNNMVAKRIFLERRKKLIETSNLPFDYKMPEFIKEDILKLKKEIEERIKKKNKKRHKKNTQNSAYKAN